MSEKYEGYSFEGQVKQTLENINVFIKEEGLKRKRLAQKLGMSESNFSDYLKGKRSNVFEFAGRLTEVLGLEGNFFIDLEFKYEPQGTQTAMHFSTGTLSKEGEDGLQQVLRICDLIETYDMGDASHA